MNRSREFHWRCAALVAFGGIAAGIAAAQAMAKPQVANLIAKVENGTDEFRDYLKSAARMPETRRLKQQKRGVRPPRDPSKRPPRRGRMSWTTRSRA